MNDKASLDELKSKILLKMGYNVLSPSDCKVISLAIQKEVNKTVSETTLKRLFGFANITSQFSKFTLNTLKEFIEHGELEQERCSQLNEIVKIQAQKITQTTLKNIKSRSAVPYELTIARKFSNLDFDFFYKSEFSYTVFIAQPGYGKSILLSHLLADLIEDPDYQQDFLCFIEAKYVFNPDQNISLSDEIAKQLGIPEECDFFDHFNQQFEKQGKKFVLFLDGFSELDRFIGANIRVFDRILEFISGIEQRKGIKLVLSMRPTIWNRFFERIRHAYFLKRKWFPGSYYYQDHNGNIPPLSEKELAIIIEKMNPGEFQNLSTELKSQLKFPYQIQWYHRLKEQYPSFNSYTNTTFFEIIDLYVNEKIYKSINVTEKVYLCTQVIKLTNYNKPSDRVPKSKLMQFISSYKGIYEELIVDGILIEEKQIQHNFATEYIRFLHPHIFEYFLFKEILGMHQQQVDTKFFTYIQQEFAGHQARFQLLQWAIRQTILTGNLQEIESLFTLNLSIYEQNYLIYFIGESLSYRCIDTPQLREQIHFHQIHDVLMKQLVHFDFVDSCYKNAINCLIETVDTPQNEKIYHTLLAIIDTLSLNIEQIKYRLEKLKTIEPISIQATFNPVNSLELIYFKLTDQKVQDHDIKLVQFTDLKYLQESLHKHNEDFPSLECFTSFLLAILTQAFYGKQQDFINLSHIFLGNYPKLARSKTNISIYLLNIIALSSARIHPNKKTDQMERVLHVIYQSQAKTTLYSQALQLILKAQQCKNRKQYVQALELGNEALPIFQRNDLALYQILIYNFLISIQVIIGNAEEASLLNLEKIKLMRKKNVSSLNSDYINLI